jgi:cellulose synthase/poly-beta-1,6-N-acetylglucosamine synthase-like glycosyltransferase
MTPISNHIFEAIFWVSAGLIAYIYIGYPLSLGMLARFAPRQAILGSAPDLAVTLLISAYNESAVIEEKIKNSLALDYPKNLLDVVVVSDCSDDGTDDIVRRYERFGVRLVRLDERKGKTTGLNSGVPQARGQIVVFSDANALYQADAIRQLVRHFADPRVGYVVGNARYVEKASESSSSEAEGLYWKLETWLKKQESAFYSVVGGDGAIYAIRRELYTPMLPTDINDFLNPLQIIDRGYWGIFEPGAISYEETAESFAKEFRRKVRIISRSLNAVGRVSGILNPSRQPRHWFLLVSHKLLRWFAPPFMIGMLMTSLFLWGIPFFRVLTILQAAFYGLALIGWILQEQRKTLRVVSLPFYFCLVNAASLIGCVRCIRGDLSGVWTPPRQNVSGKA